MSVIQLFHIEKLFRRDNMGETMKKTINLLSLLLLISVASSQASVFGRFAQRARQSVTKMYDRVPARGLSKAVDAVFVGTAVYYWGRLLFDMADLRRKADEQGKTDDERREADERWMGVSLAEAIESLGKEVDEVCCLERCKRQGYKDVAEVVCSGKQDGYGLTPEQARKKAIARMEQERAGAGSVEPLKFTRTKMTTNGRKVCLPENHLLENDPLIKLWDEAHKDVRRFIATAKATAEAFKPKEQKNEASSTHAAAQPTQTSSNGDRSWPSRHAIDAELVAAEPIFDLGALGKSIEEINKKPEYQ